MSDKTSIENHDLAQVLNRINALMQRNEVATESVAENDDIPVLTEVYDGADAQLTAVNLQHFPTLNQMANETMAANAPLTEELADRFLAEIQPLILKAVKVAVLEESVKAEKVLTSKLEQDILELLRQRLTTNLS
ncbi:MAG TPA: hypothetical protein VK974_11995 [Methylophilaceae bacterium]|nr:hypothetical protein [Methylophilaceae bacterium]